MNKLNAIRKYLQNADIAYNNDNGEEYHIRVDNHDDVRFLSEKKSFIFTNEQLENARFENNDLVIGEYHFECKKISDCPVPPELMSSEDLDSLFEDIADECEGSVRYGYSGRAMYGKRCYGVVTSDVGACIHAAKERGLEGERSDNMGLDMIIYWPNIECKKDEENE
jgi:hypothetical protein